MQAPPPSIDSAPLPPAPRTPSFGTAPTPYLSSPETPAGEGRDLDIDIRTPGQRVGDHVRIGEPKDEGSSPPMGLGYGDLEGEGKGALTSRDMEVGTSGSAGAREMTPSRAEEGEEEVEWPKMEELRELQRRIDGMGEGEGDALEQRDELKGMMTKLLRPALSQLPFLREQVEAQRDTIHTLQESQRLTEHLVRVERERFAAERSSWQTSTKALMQVRDNEIAAGTRPKKLLDLDVGYHQELEAANKRLEMDNRLMAPRLADTQRQIDKLVTELRHLRSHVVLSSQPLWTDAVHPPMQPHAGPSDSQQYRKSRSPDKSAARHVATMGDARTEHLLLAARKVRAMRMVDDRVGRLTLDELRRGGAVGPDGGVGYAEGYGGQADDEDEEYSSDEEEVKPFATDRRGSTSGKGKGKALATPLLPRAKRSSKRALPVPTTPSSKRSHAQFPQTTPGGSNFTDLLRAAELATRPGTPTPPGPRTQVPMSAMSATRSTTRTREESVMSDDRERRGSPVKRARREAWDGASRGLRLGEHEHEESGESALDLLAQASQLDEAQGEDSPSRLTFGGALNGGQSSSHGGLLAPAIDLRSTSSAAAIEDHQIDPALSSLPHPGDDSSRRSSISAHAQPQTPFAQATPKARQRAASTSARAELTTPARGWGGIPESPFEDTPLTMRERELREEGMKSEGGGFQSPTGATVPGLGRYVHLTSSVPARRVRSPYLKWTVEEDELLARAVAIHGEKWDLVSKGVPTRSYHQVRQRWLRKTGAFDKKPSSGGGPGGGGPGGQQGEGGGDDNGDSDSPTPSGRTPSGSKKRKAL